MKLFFLVLFTCVHFNQIYAQAKPFDYPFSDDLAIIDGSLTSKYLPNSKGFLTYAAYSMEVEDFMEAIRGLYQEMLKKQTGDAHVSAKAMITNDISYYIKMLVKDYRSYYGWDSLGYEELNRVRDGDSNSPSYSERIKKAREKAFTKKMDKSTRDSLNEFIFGDADPNNADLFARSASYRQWLGEYIEYTTYKYFEDDPLLGYAGRDLTIIKGIKKEILNSTLKDFLYFESVCNAVKQIKNDSVVNKIYHDFKNDVNNEYYQSRLDTIYKNYQFLADLASSLPDFYFRDVNDNKISLSALKGKYVYIDVWATWCGPCKKEIPYLKTLERQFKDKDIVFMSISLDKEKDFDKWKRFVLDNELQGIQVIANNDFNSDFAKKFNINSIPRFIFISPEMKLVSGDEKRPSDPSLAEYFDSLFNN